MANVGGTLRIEVAEETVCRLLEEGRVCVADFRCLDCKSKDCLWRLCLECCAKKPPACHRDPSTDGVFCLACGGHSKDDRREP